MASRETRERERETEKERLTGTSALFRFSKIAGGAELYAVL